METPSNELLDRERAITSAHGPERMYDTCWGWISWEEYCERELLRLWAKGDTGVRIARGNGRIWLTR